MKANEAPEKIYVSQHSGLHSYMKNNEDDIEYTRTDAFIEKACEWINNNVNLYLHWGKYVNSGRMTEDFKKYMKGE